MLPKKTFKPAKIKELRFIQESEVEEYVDKGYQIKRVKGQIRAFKELEKWEYFEARVRLFMENLGFAHVNKTPVTLGGHKVDAIGACDETFLIVECKSRGETVGNPKTELEKFNGWKEDISRDVKAKYPQYPLIKFIFCTDFILEPGCVTFADQNGVYRWDTRYIAAYERLYPILGDSTKYHILFELGSRPKDEKTLNVPAIRIVQRDRTIYSFFLEPEVLLKIAYVFRRTSSQMEKAYQRPLKKDRIENIRRFLEEQNGVFINNIIMNFKDKVEFTPLKMDYSEGELPTWSETGVLRIPRAYCSAELIDGQHRTYGFTDAKRAKREVKLPIVALDNASETERATFFIKINKEQKPVEANLLWDLAGEVEPDTDSGLISNTVKSLNKSEPFKGKIYIPSESMEKKNPILLANFCNGIEDRELHRIFNDKDALFKILKTYFEQVEKLFEYDWRQEKKGFMCHNSGVNVMLRILKKILAKGNNQLPTKPELIKLLKPISIHFKKIYHKKRGPSKKKMSQLRKRCASESGRGDVEIEFWNELVGANPSYQIED
ncbi:MAG: DGQHR domain-containing protein [candidate division Zixibacteria bacterium]|nr:DGQHR domain-containing protein [candidate division Zixibacteria bacterium]